MIHLESPMNPHYSMFVNFPCSFQRCCFYLFYCAISQLTKGSESYQRQHQKKKIKNSRTKTKDVCIKYVYTLAESHNSPQKIYSNHNLSWLLSFQKQSIRRYQDLLSTTDEEPVSLIPCSSLHCTNLTHSSLKISEEKIVTSTPVYFQISAGFTGKYSFAAKMGT